MEKFWFNSAGYEILDPFCETGRVTKLYVDPANQLFALNNLTLMFQLPELLLLKSNLRAVPFLGE